MTFDGHDEFICGVVEGFYGKPWTTLQRKDLFSKMQTFGMNTYVYAPKDDLKHRVYWRELYTVEEADHLQSLINAAKEHNVEFVYALSPGLDVTYSSSKEMLQAKQKLEQVKSLGCNAFALLFDDIETSMNHADKQVFSSFAYAQVNFTNEIFEHLGVQKFMLCPTEYCESRTVPDLQTSEYLSVIGQKLLPQIHVMWTGPRVVSRILSCAHLKRVADVLKRRPLIWDNLHANDYDQKRVFLGPYAGRSTEIKNFITGVVTNPNCEFESNCVAFYTLAHWSRCTSDADIDSDEDGKLEAGSLGQWSAKLSGLSPSVYHPFQALDLALQQWLVDFSLPKHAVGNFLSRKPPALKLQIPGTQLSVTSATTCSSADLSGVALQKNPFIPDDTTPLSAHIVPGTPAPPVASLVQLPHETPVEVECPNPELTPVSQAVNSLSNEYETEPMECVTSSSSVAPFPLVSGEPQSTEQTFNSHGDGHHKLESRDDFQKPPESKVEDVDSKGSAEAVEVEMTVAESLASATTLTAHASIVHSYDDDKSNLILSPKHVTVLDDDTMQITKGSPLYPGSPYVVTDDSPHAGSSDNRASAFSDEANMQIDKDGYDSSLEQKDEDIVIGEAMSPIYSAVSKQDIALLSQLFYLPFDHGPLAYWIQDEFSWLRLNANVVRVGKRSGSPEQADEWFRRAAEFQQTSVEFNNVFLRILNCSNRGLVYDLYPYMWEMVGMLNLLKTHIAWLGGGNFNPKPIDDILSPLSSEFISQRTGGSRDGLGSDTPETEPWTYHRAGGLLTDLQKQLPLETGQDLFTLRPPFPPTSRCFLVRLYESSDRDAVYRICRQTLDDGTDASHRFVACSDVPGDRFVGTFLDLSREYCFVLEDSESKQLLGFALAAKDSKAFHDQLAANYMPSMRQRYPLSASPSSVQAQESAATSKTEFSDETEFSVGSTASYNQYDEAGGDGGAPYISPKELVQAFHSMDCTVPQSLVSRYPSVTYLRVLPDAVDSAAPKRLAVSVLAALKANGSHGVYAEINVLNRNLFELHARLGFFEVTMVEDKRPEIVYLGRIL